MRKLRFLQLEPDSDGRQLPERPLLRGRDRFGIIVGALLMLSLLMVFAMSIVHDDDVSREALTDRFRSRADLTASFVTGYVEDVATREEAQASRLLSQPDVANADFEQVVLGFGFDVAGLFDDQGRLLAIWPDSPDLIGEAFADRYAYVATALTGRTGVSGVVASATTSSPVVAVAVPFETSSGRRVFSGALRPDTGSLRIYFDNAIPLAGRTYLIDAKGNVVVAGESGSAADLGRMLTPGGLLRLDQPVGTFESDGSSLTYVRVPVAGTPWQVILTTPSEILYKPIEGASKVSWDLFSAFAVSALVGLVLFVRLARARSVAAAIARLDALTRLPNRRAAEEHLERTASASSRHSQPYGVLMIDVDRFKAINDTYGHQAGDQVLFLVARTLRSVSRGDDVVCRWGGEEFVVILSNTTESKVTAAAERFRAAVAEATTQVSPTRLVGVTISVGGAVSADGPLEDVLNAADAALYDAKLGGRNRVVIHHAESVPGSRLAPR